MRSVLAVLGLSFAFVACSGGAEPATGSGEADITNAWSAVLTCDGGAAVLDVDRSTPRSLQFVVREPAIARYLSSKVNHIQNVRGEVIVRGWAENEVNDGAAFDRFVDDALHFDSSDNFDGTHSTRVVAEVARDGGDRLRLAFTEITTDRSCSGYIEDRYCRNGTWSRTEARRELANWGFQSCR